MDAEKVLEGIKMYLDIQPFIEQERIKELPHMDVNILEFEDWNVDFDSGIVKHMIKYGILKPIIIDGYKVIDGRIRASVAKACGFPMVPVKQI